MPFRKLFLSRWSALLWAGGMVWTAVDAVGFGPPAHPAAAKTAADRTADDGATPDTTDATGMNVNADDLSVLANAMKAD